MLAALVLALVLVPLATPPQKGKAGDKAKAFAGEWMTDRGPMKLSAKGAAISGRYGWASESELEGKLDGERLTFEWKGPYGRGDGWFELWKDGRTFGGEASHLNGKAFFGGYRFAPAQAEAKPGTVTDGQTKNGLEYHLRVPKGYDPKKRYTALALFHGSNTNARDYVEGFPGNWPKIAERYVLVGFEGEQLSPASHEGARAFNATYVEFSGERVGEPWRYNQTPALVAAALEQLAKELPIERWYASGHSQGGFLTLALAMFYPEHLAGAIEVAGNLLVQCEPDFFDDDTLRAAQRRLPIALVHGEKDSVVEYSAATYTFDALDDGGFPLLRLFHPPKLGHPWAFLPLDAALEWLDALTSSDPEALASFAERSIESEDWRDATNALRRARTLAKEPALGARLDALAARIDRAAAAEAEPLAKAIAANKDAGWVDAFWSFRARFGASPAAEGVLRSYQKLRDAQEGPARERFDRARILPGDAEKQALYREIVADYYASRWYRLVKTWLKP